MSTGDYLVLRQIYDNNFKRYYNFRVEVYDEDTLEMKEIVIDGTIPIRSFEYQNGDVFINQD